MSSDLQVFDMDRGLLFDLDGTLADTLTDIADSVNHALARLSLAPRTREEVRGFVGNGTVKMMERALGEENRGELEAALGLFSDHYHKHHLCNTALYDGVAELLAEFRGDYRLGVLTNKDYEFSTNILNGLGVLDCFDMVVGGDTLSVKKPDPRAVFLFAQRFGIPMDRIVIVGDHVTDIQTARNAGCGVVFCEYGIGRRSGLEPDASVRSFRELPGAIERALGRIAVMENGESRMQQNDNDSS